MTTYISDREIKARPCSHCGMSWAGCLLGNNRGPEGVCCGACHYTDTHEAAAARRVAARERAMASHGSGGWPEWPQPAVTNAELWKELGQHH